MKIWRIVSILFLGLASSPAQLVLNQGESWTYEFSTIPYYATSFSGPPWYTPLATLGGGLLCDFSLASGAALQVELFEDGPTGAPLFSVVRTSNANSNFAASSCWSDRNGSVRFTALTGSVSIASFRLHRWYFRGGGFVFDGYETTVIPQLPPLKLDIQRLTNAIRLSWPTLGSTGYQLETTNQVPGPFWNLVTNLPTVITGFNNVTLSTTNPIQFFRLRK